MANRLLSLVMMGTLSLVLFTVLSFVALGQSQPGAVWLWGGWIVSLTLTAVVVWQAKTARRAWGWLSVVTGVVSFVLLLAIVFVPISASHPYEPEANWLHTVDLTPPIATRLREALASAYFAIAIIVAGVILLSVAYVLLHASNEPKRHMH